MNRPHSHDAPMRATHTFGPWIIRRQFSGSFKIVGDLTFADIANVRGEPNARLIAAAPELLAALRACYTALGMVDDFPTASGGEHPDVQNNALDTARAAIAKATGTP